MSGPRVTVRYTEVPRAPRARRWLVAALTPDALALGLHHGDVIQHGEDGTIFVLRAVTVGPPAGRLEPLIASGTLQELTAPR